MSKVYVLGGAQTDFERNWTKEGKGIFAILKEAMDDGLAAVGMTYEEIAKLNKDNRVAIFVGNFIAEKYCDQSHLGSLLTKINPNLYGVPSARYEAACASGSVALDAAITKVRAGDYDVAITIGWELMKTVSAKVGGDFLGHAADYQAEAKGVDFPFPTLFGKMADALIERYKLDETRFMKNLATISAINYENAKRNPQAQTRKWFMDEAQANDRGTATNMAVGGKIAISDCSQVTDGAAVVVVCNEKFAVEKKGSTAGIPIVKGWGHRVAPINFDLKMADSEFSACILPWTQKTVEDAYKRAGLSVNEMDFFETHDCFTSSEYAAIGCFGITEPGKEYEAIESGKISMRGDKPINPSGGLIGCGHPVGASGVRMMLDLYKQVTGQAGDYQVKDAKNGIMLNFGGTATTNYAYVIGM
ncbi:MAG: acetyl-CoA acetyltransferase [Oscillospiraceae bacterium]|nr:acetyl-CoA acetyltransferase [Oscillospiraceae bacterium]